MGKPCSKTPEALSDSARKLFDQSCDHLGQDESEQLCELLYDFQDVFAKDDFDLGNFTQIEHSIDTGDPKPVMQKLRRTPLAFAAEEKHMGKTLKAGVISTLSIGLVGGTGVSS